MLSDYILKENCPYCNNKLKTGWKFCAKCGRQVNNDGPRIRISKYFHQDLKFEDNKFYDGNAFYFINTISSSWEYRFRTRILTSDFILYY